MGQTPLACAIVGMVLISGCTQQVANAPVTNAAAQPVAAPNSVVPARTEDTPAPPAAAPQEEVALEDDNGTFRVPVLINGAVRLSFTIDSGATDVTIPADVAMTLVRTGTITRPDFIGNQTFILADGSTMPSPVFRIRSLKVGNLELRNVAASITNVNGSLLLGQTFLSRLGSWSIDNRRHILALVGTLPGTDIPVTTGTPSTVASVPNALAPAPEAPQAGNGGEMAEAAKQRAEVFYETWSGSDPQNAENVRPFFADSVEFYGSLISVDELMAKERQFALRWPVRQYVARPESLYATCSNEHTCTVEGLVDWRASSPLDGRYSAGVAQFSFVFSDGLIVAESGKVVSRG
jgi:clan AA aspartic protease (TIGR02281 family)